MNKTRALQRFGNPATAFFTARQVTNHFPACQLLTVNDSKIQLGALVSQSFAEKMNSARKNIVSDHQTQLDSDTTSKLTCLRMNKGFMEFARQFNARKRGRN